MSQTEPAPAPIACRLDPPEMAGRRRLWEEVARAALVRRQEIPGGARLELRALPGIAERVTRLAELERDCCAFATFSVHLTEDRVVLDIESSGEGVEAVRRMFGAC